MAARIVNGEHEPMVDDVPVVRGTEPFESFYRNEYRPVLALAHVLSGSPAHAEELVQDAFVAAYRNWDRIDRPDAWIRQVVANKARSMLRRRYAEAKALTRLGGSPATTIDPMPADSARFWAEVRRLPTRQAQAVTLHYLEDRSIAETAALLGCAESTARVHLSRGRRTLAKRIGAEES